MEDKDIKSKAVSGFKWGLIDNFANSGITFLVGVILANLLTPEEFGVLAIITIFINISLTIVDGGFATALIRKIDCKEYDYNTAFFSNLAISVILVIVLIIASPFIAQFFSQPILQPVVVAMSSILVINACGIIPKTILIKKIDFRSQALASLISSVTSGVLGVVLALLGYGVWSLVFQQICRQVLFTSCLWLLQRWLPGFSFSVSSFKDLFGFGVKILIAHIINSIYKDIFLVVIGKMYSAKSLGYYNRAEQFNQIFSNNLTMILQKVSLPTLTQFQNEVDRLRFMYRKFTLYSAIITFALVFGLAAAAEPVIMILVGKEWIPSIRLLQIMSLYGAIYPLQLLNLNVLNIMKRSDRLLKLEIIKKVIFIPVVLVGFWFELQYMIWAAVIYYYIEFFLNGWYTKELIGYSTLRQVSDLFPVYAVSFAVSFAVWSITLLDIPYWIMLALQILSAAVLYFVAYRMIRLEEFSELINIVVKQLSFSKVRCEK